MTTVTFAAVTPAASGERTALRIDLVGEDERVITGYVLGDEEQIVRPYEEISATGEFSVDLVPTDDITPSGSAYKATLTSRGAKHSFVFSVPASGTHDVGSLLTDAPGALTPSALAAHIGDLVDAHDASAVSFAATGSIASTDVQAAIEEVATEYAVADTSEATARANADLLRVLKAGDTMTGPLVLPGDPASALHAAPKQYVDATIAAVVAAAPGTLDTLAEIDAAIGNDPNFATTMTTALAGKVSLTGNQTVAGVKDFTSTPTVNGEAVQHAYEIVNHGAASATARPSGTGPVLWIGSVAPSNIADNDLWVDTSTSAATITAPSLIVPPASNYVNNGNVTWFAQYGAVFHRFCLPADRNYRWFLWSLGVLSGNVQLVILKLSGTSLLDYTRVATKSIDATTLTTGAQRTDLGSSGVDLTAGDYALGIWVDNTTLTAPVAALSAGGLAPRWTCATTLTSSGIPSSGTLPNWGSARSMSGLAMEANV